MYIFYARLQKDSWRDVEVGELEEGHCQQGPGEGATTFRRAKKRFFLSLFTLLNNVPHLKLKRSRQLVFLSCSKKKMFKIK